jgi:hypothetical protein
MRQTAQKQLHPQGKSHASDARVGRFSRAGAWTAAAVTLLSVAGLLSTAAPASAGLQQEFAVFSDCPVSNPAVVGCVYSKVTGGEFTLGSKTVTINQTVVLQGGVEETTPKLVPAADGETLSRTPLTVPGGLVGVEGLGGEVTATAELAGSVELNPSNLLGGHGTAVTLPLKVKLDNPVLGSACFIGSTAEAVSIHLTTGTTNPPGPNTSISGSHAKQVFAADGKIVLVPSSTLVDNAFAVPGASGCGGLASLLVDPAVDLSAGVPAAAGHNTAIMSGELETTSAQAVKNQAVLPEIGRCEPAESTGSGKTAVFHGGYSDSGCTLEEPGKLGRYEWTTGPGAKPKFSGSAKTTLQGVSGGKVVCSGGTSSGEYTGAKTLTASLVLTGCKSQTSKQQCQSASAAAGEIVTSPLAGSLGFVEDIASETSVSAVVGVDFSHAPTLLSAECGGLSEQLEVKGSVIVPISKIDKMSTSFSLKGKATAGKQQPEEFEGGVKDTLTATLGAGPEQAGLTTTGKLANEEPLEIKAITTE